MVMPVPLCAERLKTRKYNQAKLIAEKFCQITNLPLDATSLVRTKNTPPQAKLTFKERRNNIIGAFKVVDRSKAKDKIILLIDDVYTTGSTINECAKLLIKAGAKKVFAITAGHTVVKEVRNETLEECLFDD
jgi:ComF family protein